MQLKIDLIQLETLKNQLFDLQNEQNRLKKENVDLKFK